MQESETTHWNTIGHVAKVVLAFPFTLLVFIMFPVWVIALAVWGIVDYRRQMKTLTSQGRLVNFEDALAIVDREDGCFVMIETMKGPMGEVWLARGEYLDTAMALPTLEDRAGWQAFTDEKDLRLECYAPYMEQIGEICTEVMDLESGEGELVKMNRRERRQVDEHPRTRVAFIPFTF